MHREMVSTREVFCLLLVAIMWGGTNPFLKKGTEGIEGVQKDNTFLQFLAEIKFLFLNIKYLFPFLLNQSGSFVFYFTLASTDLSLAVPMVNSLTFLFTLLMGKLLGEEVEGKRAVLGMLLIMSGVTACVLSSVSETDSAGARNTGNHYIPLD
ncbi:transmembrane protein 234-like [Carassius auratus]|uniref:Transmembrane protein 234-like n=1 Tax=Carassius auratus TaxID=7957 RepID=A0A6P6QL71_CARAU|nr:transmembrane protein 234-like [Carassius auratus]